MSEKYKIIKKYNLQSNDITENYSKNIVPGLELNSNTRVDQL